MSLYLSPMFYGIQDHVVTDSTPFAGTGAFAIQSSAFNTTLRWFGLPQFACV